MAFRTEHAGKRLAGYTSKAASVRRNAAVLAVLACGSALWGQSPPATSFITGYALNLPDLREDFGGWVGMNLTVGANPLYVSRRC